MNITAIILNYKNYQDVCTCIKSLRKQVLPVNFNLQILVIDNNSEDESTKKLQATFPENQYIYNSKNLGFAKGVNQGIQISFKESDYFLLVNNDAELATDCLEKLLTASNGESLSGPAIFYKQEPGIAWQGGGFFSKLKMGVTVPDKNQPVNPYDPTNADFLSGCVLLIPKKVIDITGYFDERFFFYGEDLDFCLRAKKNGISILYCSSAQAWHNIKRIAVSRTNRFVLNNLAFSYQLIIKKHFPKLRIYALLLFIFIYTPFRFYQLIKGKNDLRNIFSWLKGGWRGWNEKI